MTAAPSVAIVILNWNGKHYLEKFLPAVLQTQYNNLEVVVADNASSDGSVTFLQSVFPAVNIIELERNFGFAAGYNEALRKLDADYFVLLNSDVEITPDWLQPLIAFLEQQKQVAAVQPKILSYHNRHLFEYAGAAGGWLDQFGYPFSRGRVFDVCEKDEGQYNDAGEIFWASGAALVIRSNCFWEAGGFDPYFFAHMEEIDLCWRLQLLGYKIAAVPASVVFHVGGGTLPKGNSRKTFLNFRNNQIMLAKNLPWSEKWWKIPFRLMMDQLAAVKALFSGDFGYFRAIIRSHLAFIYWIVFRKKSMFPLKRKKLSTLSGVFTGNLVWEYFINKKQDFRKIVEEDKNRNSF